MARRKKKFRSGLERRIAEELRQAEKPFDYEPFKVRFTQPAKSRLYLPDFILPNGIIIEAKGRWQTADRRKFVHIFNSHPDIDIRFVFSNAHSTLSKRSSTTYAEYCDGKGWIWAHRHVPTEWADEPRNEAAIAVLREQLKDKVNQ